MNIIKDCEPVLIKKAVTRYGAIRDLYCIYLEGNAFWKIGGVCAGDRVIYTKSDKWANIEISGVDYQDMCIGHNTQLLKLVKPLDDAELKYLKGVINPFRKRVDCITKNKDIYDPVEYITISFKDSEDIIMLPDFKKGTMYKGMIQDRDYSVEELGL